MGNKLPKGVTTEEEVIDPKVINGTACEMCFLHLSGIETLEIPDNFSYEHKKETAKMLQFFVLKRLSFMGHPPKKVSIVYAKDNMGMCYKKEDKKMTVGTYGEFQTMEGGATIKCHLVVPENVEVKKIEKLSGQNSECNDPDEPAGKGYWYASTKPKKEFTILEYKNTEGFTDDVKEKLK